MVEPGSAEPLAPRRSRIKGGPRPEASRRVGHPALAASLLGRLLDAPTRRVGFADARIVADWPTIVGPEVAAVAIPLRLDRRSGKLVLQVRPTAALLLQHQEPQLLERVNAFFGLGLVWRLELVQAPLPPVPVPPEPRPLDPGIRARIEEEVAVVEAPALRRALADLGVAIRGGRAPA
jgi:hypothetical protein